MSSWPDARSRCIAAVCLLATSAAALAQGAYPGIGRTATPQEVAAWDTDVRPDFKGLPPGAGSVAQGMVIWEARCASCHGVFGESNQAFTPLVGGTTAADIRTGRAARLLDPAFPGRTTLMKLASLSTLWDTIYRSMPWTAPKSLQPDEVYAVTAYLLNLGGIVPDDTVLSNLNIAAVQERLPNRLGMTTDHGLWPGRPARLGGIGNGGRPDVKAIACMNACAPAPQVVSALPEHARNAHGNLAGQNRSVGAQRGADTSRAAYATPAAAAAAWATATATPAPPAEEAAATALALADKHLCLACHGVETKVVGPAFREVARKYEGRADIVSYLAGRIRAGGTGLWGAIAMPPQTVGEDDARTLARWLAEGAPR